MSKLIALDNGHGISTNGKRSPIFTDGTRSPLTGKNFFHEWEYNRGTVIFLDAELKRCGFKTIQVSPTEDDTSLTVRANRTKQAKADLLVSIHANANTGVWGTWGGTEQLACGTESIRIAKLIQEEMVKELKLRDRGIKDGCWLGITKNAGGIPVVLVESFFMDGVNEAKLGFSDGFMKRSAIAIAKGICRAYGVKYVPETIKSTQPKIEQKGDDDKLNLTNYQWGELEKNVKTLLAEKIITSESWVTKAQNKTLTISEVCWLNNMVLMRLRK